LDAVRGQILFAPLGVLVAAFVVATAYGPLWTAGYGWREIISREDCRRFCRFGPRPLDSDEFGPHAVAIQQARTDRAALRAALERLPEPSDDRSPRQSKPRMRWSRALRRRRWTSRDSTGRSIRGLRRSTGDWRQPQPNHVAGARPATRGSPTPAVDDRWPADASGSRLRHAHQYVDRLGTAARRCRRNARGYRGCDSRC